MDSYFVWGVSCFAFEGSGLRPKGSLTSFEGSSNYPSFRFDEGARGEPSLLGHFRARRRRRRSLQRVPEGRGSDYEF